MEIQTLTAEQDKEDLVEQAQQIIFSNAVKSSDRKRRTDKIVRGIFLVVTVLCASIILIVAGYILVKGIMPFFQTYNEGSNSGSASLTYFLFGTTFKYGYDAATGYFWYGAWHLVFNTIYINILAAIISIPTSILTALFITRIAPKPLAKTISTGVDILAAIPSVIYGIFGMGVIVPIVKSIANAFGMVSASGMSLFSGAIILALMSIPTMVSVSVTSLQAVDEALIQGSMALGATKTQTNFKICLSAAKSGIFAAIILGIGRAMGEATAVSMVSGASISGLTLNPFDSTMTLTSQMLSAIGEAVNGSLNYDIRFSLGILLMLIIIVTNLILNDVKESLSSVEKRPIFIVRWAYKIRDFSVFIYRKIKNAVQKQN